MKQTKCRCGHEKSLHEHHRRRPGPEDCAICECPKFRRFGRRREYQTINVTERSRPRGLPRQ